MKKQLFAFLTLWLLLVSNPSRATSYTWTGSTNTDWNTATNWSPNGVPTATDNVIIVSATRTPLLDATRSVTDFTLTSGSLNLGGFTLNITGNAAVNAGSITNGSINASGSSTTFGSTGNVTMGAQVTVNSATIVFKRTTFNGSVNLTKTGPSNDSSTGGNTFHGVTTFINSGTGSFTSSNTTRDVFNNNLTLINTGASGLYVSGFNVGTQFNGNLIVNSTNGLGIFIGNDGRGAAKAVLASGKVIQIGNLGFPAGSLAFNGFIQQGTTPQWLVLTGGAKLQIGLNSTFQGPVDFKAPRLSLDGCTYQQTALLEKTGSGGDTGVGGNVFNGVTTLKNSGSGGLVSGSASYAPDVFNTDLTLTNTGSGSIQLGSWSANNQLKGNVTLNCAAGQGITLGNEYGDNYLGSDQTIILAMGKTLSIGSFTAGTLTLFGFVQQGSTPQSLVLTGTAALRIGSRRVYNTPSVFNGPVDFTAPHLYLDGATYMQESRFTKTGSGADSSIGGNIFKKKVNIFNVSSGTVRMATAVNDLIN